MAQRQRVARGASNRATTLKTSKWDVTRHLDTEEKIALFLEAVFEDGDPATIAAAIVDVARARGMSQIAKDAGLSRENLYRLSVRTETLNSAPS